MGRLGYYFRVASRALNPKKIVRMVDRVHRRSGKNRFVLFWDMLWCGVRYGAGWNDYLIFGWYDMNAAQRDTYVTRVRNKKLITRLNDQTKTDVIDNKGLFRKKFAAYLGREVADVRDLSREDFARFVEGRDAIIAKPYIGESGKGIEKLKRADFADLDAFYDYVTSGRFGLIEEIIVQHPALAHVYPHALNTYRIVTVVGDDGEVYCAYATAKFGAGGNFVDNMENGGICCPIDRETGRLCGCAHTSALKNYDRHPDTGVELMGYPVPKVDEAVEICRRAAREAAPDIRFVGWDAFVTEQGVGIIEGNDYPGYDFWQLPEHTPDKIGLMPFFRKVVPGAFR
ncbi:MAG: carboxylate--amine ligase [Oscillospiraceae bacterium]|nr:carboxylate--amine ligase [Oscillospiraceae bacterium]